MHPYFRHRILCQKVRVLVSDYGTWFSNTCVLFSDALRNWRQLQKDAADLSAVLLGKCGIWGCVLGGVVASNIAQ